MWSCEERGRVIVGRRTLLAGVVAVAVAGAVGAADRAKGTAPVKKEVLTAETLSGLELRGIGPALMSGRIGDFAVNPGRPSEYYVAVASGGVWKTVNAGTTWTPIFDKEGSYSIGCLALDPANPYVIWVGSGENNSQRSVAWGDGVYRSLDGGATWKNMGLGKSEHIGMIRVDPRNSNVVYVAAQGPLWAPGGDRGLYKTIDGGATWKAALTVSENTGISEVHFDPRNPDVLYASAYQRRRHVWTLINGGPESAIYKSTDAGATWRKLQEGLPKVDLGRIGLAISPVNPDVLYAIVEAAEDKGGVFRSTNRGETWEKRSDYMSGSGQYYNELFCDPRDVDRLYSMDVFLQVSVDGGKTFKRLGEKSKHVDNHALWIDPSDPTHLLVGCDGGIYESWDRGANWQYKANLPVTQFYRVAVDNSKPFYSVYGGTQDNSTQGGPSRTTRVNGIVNADWFIVTGGDGFEPQVDPENPDIVYGQSQYGYLVRFDRKSGEEVDIRPQEGRGEPPLRFNWDSPVLISPHSHTRLYFAANRLFRSDDRGDTWTPVSGDLTRQLDRDQLPVMGAVWPADAVAKNASTSFYGNIVSLAESPLAEGLLYVGTDDGLIQVSEDGGRSWRREERFPGVPERAYVSRLEASQHDSNVVYAAFDNHKMGDFKPYLLKSTDRGRSWASIAGNLPARDVVYAVAEDHVERGLLFAGTEFGLYTTLDGGASWIQLKGGLPTISVRDLTIQKSENDLVLATFGRGFYVLDDYRPLRGLTRAALEREAALFPVKAALAYIESSPLGGRGKAEQGEAYYTAPNPPFGAVFTYYLKDGLKTARELRHEAEKAAAEKGTTSPYPTMEVLSAEAREEKPAILLTVSDAEGNVVRRLSGDTGAGFHRAAWDLRYPPSNPTKLTGDDEERPSWALRERGPMAVPGSYRVQLAKRVAGVVTDLGPAQPFEVVPLNLATLPAADRAAQLAFQQKTARLQRAVLAAAEVVDETKARLATIKKALDDTPAARPELAATARELERRLAEIDARLSGDAEMAKRSVPTPPTIIDRVQGVVASHWSTSSAPTATMRNAYAIAADEFTEVLAALTRLVGTDLAGLEVAMERAGAPWTPGRLPVWSKE